MSGVESTAHNTTDPEHKANSLHTPSESRSLPLPPPLSSLTVRENTHLGADGPIPGDRDVSGSSQTMKRLEWNAEQRGTDSRLVEKEQ